jgi:hypothetical protein
MIEVTLVIAVAALVAWRFLNYLDSMGKLQKKLRRDSLMQIKCKTLADKYAEEGKITCAICADIKGDKDGRFSFRL